MSKLVRVDLDDEQLALANWFIEEVGEFRQWDNKLLAFIYPSQLEELNTLLRSINSDFFTDGTMQMEYNGTELVIDVTSVLKYTLDNLDPKLVFEGWKED